MEYSQNLLRYLLIALAKIRLKRPDLGNILYIFRLETDEIQLKLIMAFAYRLLIIYLKIFFLWPGESRWNLNLHWTGGGRRYGGRVRTLS